MINYIIMCGATAITISDQDAYNMASALNDALGKPEIISTIPDELKPYARKYSDQPHYEYSDWSETIRMGSWYLGCGRGGSFKWSKRPYKHLGLTAPLSKDENGMWRVNDIYDFWIHPKRE